MNAPKDDALSSSLPLKRQGRLPHPHDDSSKRKQRSSSSKRKQRSSSKPGDLIMTKSTTASSSSSIGCKKRHLYLCLMPLSESRSLSVYSIPVDDLISDSSCEEKKCYSDLQQQLNHMLFLENKEEAFTQRTSFLCVGNLLYFCGGDTRDVCGRFNCAELAKWTRNFMCLDFSDPSNCGDEVKLSALEPMSSGKPSPIVVEIDGLIYVLAGFPYSLHHVPDYSRRMHEFTDSFFETYDPIPDPFFEVYDPCTNVWRCLDLPPLLAAVKNIWRSQKEKVPAYLLPDRNQRWFCDSAMFLSYIVVDKKLCVSTCNASFAFDTVTEKWEACELFFECRDPYSGSNILPERLTDSIRFHCPYTGISLFQEKEIKIAGCVPSPPFGCLWKNILFDEDILICSVSSEEPTLVAYQIVKGKVQRYQLLLDVTKHLSAMGAAFRHNFVDLGGGYICYEYDSSTDDGDFLFFVTFKVSKIDGGDDPSSDFLRCECLKTVAREIKGSYFSVYAFLL